MRAWISPLVAVVVFAVLLLHASSAAAERRCRNPGCTEAISIVRAFRDYQAPDGTFSFRRLATFSVLSKDGNMWEGNIGGKRGFFPEDAVEELTVFERNPRFVVPLEPPPSPPTPEPPTPPREPTAEELLALKRKKLAELLKEQEELERAQSTYNPTTANVAHPRISLF
ncbi:hypothetical protein PTSG_04298 [Salpingoeca rosetta]|uniref:SH3 domain-containing protein n=1 Tax=Salpingoeca rosetta (strain ATCC 50818 / BSB-021) TaxID=946362 RepID=F2U761_SALR5|nr:uncharacterized protein PTSG_04298 [Salpingoeca rosetta]EGD83693.1 hypothetical protein PTSG_04298 [Salpingoeca rosetta]|eukprot:XP_004995197.1 hypothetical protein PTSG_04298 [Salpingoeca rosetta]